MLLHVLRNPVGKAPGALRGFRRSKKYQLVLSTDVSKTIEIPNLT